MNLLSSGPVLSGRCGRQKPWSHGKTLRLLIRLFEGEGRYCSFGERQTGCFGRHNIPDGEILATIIDSVQGYITYT